MSKTRQTLAWRRGTGMSEWYALQIESGIVIRAAQLPDDLGDATKPASHYLMSLPMIDPAQFNEAPDQFYTSDTAQLLGRKLEAPTKKTAQKKGVRK